MLTRLLGAFQRKLYKDVLTKIRTVNDISIHSTIWPSCTIVYSQLLRFSIDLMSTSMNERKTNRINE